MGLRTIASPIVGLAWLAALLGVAPSWAQDNLPLETIITEAAAGVAQRFPKVQGEVVKVEGERLYLSIGAREQLLEGVQLSVFREGEELKQPSTGVSLGRVEQELGVVQVERVAERYAIGRLLTPTSGVRQGDKVRITSGQIPLGVFPVANLMERDVPRGPLTTQLQNALEATERFRIVPANRILLWSFEQGTPIERGLSPELLLRLSQELHFDYAVVPLVKDVNGKAALEIRLLSPGQQRLIAMSSAYLSDTALKQAAAAPAPKTAPAPLLPAPTAPQVATAPAASSARPLFKPSQPDRVQPTPVEWNLTEALTELRKIPALLYGMDGGDVDGDGTEEIVVATESEILLYRLEGEQLLLLGTHKVRRSGKLLSVQLLRLGTRPSIGVVVNWQKPDAGELDTFILTLQSQSLEVWQERISDILLAVDTDGDGAKETLWGQPFNERSFFSPGIVHAYTTTAGVLQTAERVAVPGVFRATGAALAQLRPDSPRSLVMIDKRRQLRVFNGASQVWLSRESVGGSYTSAELKFTYTRDPSLQSFFFEPIPAVADVDGDGIDEVLVPRNDAKLSFAPNLNQYSGGDLLLLQPEAFGFKVSAVSPQFDGAISGVAILRGQHPGVLVAVSKPKGPLGGFFKTSGETTLFLSRFQSTAVQ